MKSHFSRMLAVLLALTMLTSLCSVALAEDSNTPEPITFTVLICNATSADSWDNWTSPVAQKITEATGVTLKYEYAIGDIQQKLAVMVASGDYPDFIDANTYGSMLVDAGAYIPLNDLIDEYAPNLKTFYGENFQRLRWSEDDGNIYTIGSLGLNEVKFSPEHGFQLQHKVVMEQGYPEIKTLEQFENAIKQYVDAHPTTEDGQKTIGLSLISDDWRYRISVRNPAIFVNGLPNDGDFIIDQETFDARYFYASDEARTYFKWLCRMNAEGYLDPECFIQKYDQYLEKIATGRVVALADCDWEFGEAQRSLLNAGKPEDTYGMYPVTMTEDETYKMFYPTGFSSGTTGLGISTSCKNPERAMQFINYMVSDEAQILNNWGVEGVNYTIEDGKRVISEEEWIARNTSSSYRKDTGVDLYLSAWPHYGVGVKDPTGQYYIPHDEESILKSYSDTEKEVLANYGVTTWKELYPQESEFALSPYGEAWTLDVPADSQLNMFMVRGEELARSTIADAVMGPLDQFDAKWDAMISTLNSYGMEEAEKAWSELVKQRVEMWK
ncbi:MAG: ABC transporter substrate-binding protein [Aristaeellaceae bacterium]